MKATKYTEVNRRRTAVAAAVAFILVVVAYKVVPVRTDGVATAQPEADKALAAHGVYPASRIVSTAGALEPRFFQPRAWISLDGLTFTGGNLRCNHFCIAPPASTYSKGAAYGWRY